jgi:hypothetical protein
VIGQVVDSRWFTEESAKRGTAVHQACAFLDEDDLEESSVSDSLHGYIEAWKKFKVETGIVEFEAIEERVENGSFHGKPDRVIAKGRTPNGNHEVSAGVIDIKTGAIPKWASLQLAAYCDLTGKRVGMCVGLKQDGRYTCKIYLAQEISESLQVFYALLAVWKWRNK